MLKQVSKLEVEINDRRYSLECSPDSPLGELHDALCQMKAFVVKKIVDADKPPEIPGIEVKPDAE